MKQKTFDVLFRRYGEYYFKAFSGSDTIDTNTNWEMCPEIEGCSVATFLEKVWDKDGDTVQEFKVTIKKEEKK